MSDELNISVMVDYGQLNDIRSINYALEGLMNTPEFRDMVSVASSQSTLTINVNDGPRSQPAFSTGTLYDPTTNTVHLSIQEVATHSYPTVNGSFHKGSLQQSIVHEVEHAVQNANSLTFSVAKKNGLIGQVLTDNFIEPWAIEKTNFFNDKYFGVPARNSDYSIAPQIDTSALRSDALVLTFGQSKKGAISVSEVPDGYEDRVPSGVTLEFPDGFTVISGEKISDLPIDIRFEMITGYKKLSGGTETAPYNDYDKNERFCFLAGTPITMSDGTIKPIEEVAPEDQVMSYDEHGNLCAGRVVRTFQNESKQILDVHGLMVTPGHATLCGDGKFEGQHVPIIDILRADGTLVLEDGSLVRAATGCKVGSMGDRMVAAITGDIQAGGFTKVVDKGYIRLGTRFINDDGEDVSVLDEIFQGGGMLTEDGYIKTDISGPNLPFRWSFTPRLPKPEDYVLQRSATTLNDIYSADEWEVIRPQMPAPTGGRIAASSLNAPHALHAPTVRNVPLSMRGSSGASSLSRKERRAAKAKARKRSKRVSVTVH